MRTTQPRAPYRVAYGWRLLQLSLYAAAPICISYAVLRHRVFDIQVMVRLGLRYAAARGVLLSFVPATAFVLALDVFIHRSQPVSDILVQRGLLYTALGAAALVLHVNRKAWLDRQVQAGVKVPMADLSQRLVTGCDDPHAGGRACEEKTRSIRPAHPWSHVRSPPS